VAAIRRAGDLRLDVANLSLFADPYLYYCKSEAEQRAILSELEAAARYAQQRGVLLVVSAGNEVDDLQHPDVDTISPDWPPDAAVEREVGNNCRVAPAELPGVLTVSAVGPVGYPGYDLWIADYSSVGMGAVDVAAPGGDYLRATNTRQDAVLGALSSTGDADNSIWEVFDFLEQNGGPAFDGITVLADGGYRYGFLNGTSMAAPHATGVAALVAETHPRWGPAAIRAAVESTAQPLECPPAALANDPRRCYGAGGHTSFFGHGLVDALAAATK
jgi:subtilisin family serine protease